MNLEWILGLQVIMLIIMFIFLQKLNQMKIQIDGIIQEVTKYISYVTEDLEEEKKIETKADFVKKPGKKEVEEAQNRLIQAVLGDFFP